MNFIVAGIGAGLVSALLTAVVVKATALAFFLYILAPIPVLIVSLGWDQRAGLVAGAVGGIAIALLLAPMSGLGFVLVTALPAWWLSYLSLLGRAGANGVTEWYPVGRLLAWIAGTAALTVIAAGIISAGSYEAFQANAREVAKAFVDLRFETTGPEALKDETREQLIGWLASATPFLSAQGFTMVLALYLWTAAKIVSFSGRLPRPWPSIPELSMPRSSVLILLIGLVLANLDNFIGVFGFALAGAFVMAFALQGLAAVHERTRGKAGRVAILFGLYLLVLVTQGILMVALSLFGIAVSVFQLRPRSSAGGQPRFPQNPST